MNSKFYTERKHIVEAVEFRDLIEVSDTLRMFSMVQWDKDYGKYFIRTPFGKEVVHNGNIIVCSATPNGLKIYKVYTKKTFEKKFIEVRYETIQ